MLQAELTQGTCQRKEVSSIGGQQVALKYRKPGDVGSAAV